MVGMINTLFGYAVFFLFEFLTRSDEISLLFANLLGVLFNFNTIGRLVFKNGNIQRIFKFIGVYLLIYAINLASLKIFNRCGLASIYGEAFIVIPVVLLSFVLNKWFVFNQSDPSKVK